MVPIRIVFSGLFLWDFRFPVSLILVQCSEKVKAIPFVVKSILVSFKENAIYSDTVSSIVDMFSCMS